ncbi:protein kinase [Chloroflexota bacterium]
MNDRALIGSKLGKYTITEEIGRGGMGAVYKAYDATLDRHVAIKVLAPHLVWQEGFVERFLREARAAARLQHPNIVTIYDVGQEAGWYYYVMEYLEGKTLNELTQEQQFLPPETVLSLLQPMAAALDYAHHNGLVHRDIKPGNIIVGRAGRVSLTDFGIARAVQETRLTATGTTVGTPEYMSPEQVRGWAVDARSDQYSLAVVAYELLSGQVPFKAESTLSLMYKVVHEPPPPIDQVRPELPRQVGEVLGKALAKEPGDRYPTVTDFVEALAQGLAGRRVEAAPLPPVPRDKKAPTVLTGAAAATAGRQSLAPAAAPAAKPSRPAAPPAAPARERRGVPIWLWLLAALTVLVLAIALVLALRGGGGRGTPTAAAIVTQVVTSSPAEASPSPSSQIPPSPTATHTPNPSPVAPTTTAPPTQGLSTARPLPSPTQAATQAPTSTPTHTLTPAPSATAAASATPAATRTPEPTKVPTPRPPASTPTQEAAQFPPPNLLDPPDGQNFSFSDPIVLSWQSVGQLPPDGYYEVVLTYTPASAPSETWTDETPWTKDTSWTLSEHDYLPGLSADQRFHWAVRVMRRTGQDAQGRPTGAPLSQISAVRMLAWNRPSTGGPGAPTSPPP